MIKARTNIAAADSETRRMNDRANLDPEICRRGFQCRFDFGGAERLQRAKRVANGLKSGLVFGGEMVRNAFPGVIKILCEIGGTICPPILRPADLSLAPFQRRA